MAKTYKMKGKESFVPGLPDEISDADAKERGLVDLLKAAVEAGLYAEVKTSKKTSSGE